ncbi:c-type cytochrome biogenesis protein CcsB [Microbacterium xylanilyticum]
MTSYLESLSLLMVYSAITIYAAAFVAYTIDLARRTAPVNLPVPEVAAVGAQTPARRATYTEPDTTDRVDSEPRADRASKAARAGYALTVLGWVFQVAATVLRGVAADRVPWANMFEFSLTGTALIIATFLIVSMRVRLAYLGAAVLGLVVLLLGVATVSFYVPVVPIMPALQSAWLVIHVMIAMLATAFLGLAFLVSTLYLVKHRGERSRGPRVKRLLDTVPTTENLDRLAYRLTIIGFILWTFTLIAGAIWASRAWGRFWGWDVKEVWTFIVWVLYAAYLHATATRGWRGARAAWLSIVGFAAVVFNFGIVNVFFSGLHSYSGLK